MGASSIIFDHLNTPFEHRIHQTFTGYRWNLVTFLKNGGLKPAPSGYELVADVKVLFVRPHPIDVQLDLGQECHTATVYV